MKNTFGTSVAVTIFGESHGEYIGAVIDGLAPGIDVNEEYIFDIMDKWAEERRVKTKGKWKK